MFDDHHNSVCISKSTIYFTISWKNTNIWRAICFNSRKYEHFKVHNIQACKTFASINNKNYKCNW